MFVCVCVCVCVCLCLCVRVCVCVCVFSLSVLDRRMDLNIYKKNQKVNIILYVEDM